MSELQSARELGSETVGLSMQALLALAFTVAGSLALRVWGVNHGLPEVYEHDEIHAAITALRHGSGDLAPLNFIHGTLTAYLLSVVFGLYYAIGKLGGLFVGPDDFLRQFAEDPTSFYAIGRATMAFIGTGTVWAIYVAGARLYDRTTGLLAALFLGVSPLHVNMSHLIKEDILAAALLTFGFLQICRGVQCVEQNGTVGLKPYLGAGFLIGLAVSAKYYSAPAFVWVVILAGFESVRRPQCGLNPLQSIVRASKPVAAGILAVLGGFLVGEPFVLVRFHEFVRDALGIVSTYSPTLIPNPDGASSSYIYLMKFIPYSIGVPLSLVVVVGFASALRMDDRLRFVLVVSFPAIFLVTLFQRSAFPSFLTPAIPFLALIAAALVGKGFRLGRFWGWITAAVTFGLIFPPLLSSLRYDRYILAEDTRHLAKNWIESTVPAGETIAVEGAVFELIVFGPSLTATNDVFLVELAEIKKRGATGRLWQAYMQVLERKGGPRYRLCKAVELTKSILDACGSRYVVVVTDQADRTWGSTSHDREEAFLRTIKDQYVLLKQFEPYPGMKFIHSHWAFRNEFPRLAAVDLIGNPQELITGPRIKVYKRRDPE